MFPIRNSRLSYTTREHEIDYSVRAILAFDGIIYNNVITKMLQVLPKNGREDFLDHRRLDGTARQKSTHLEPVCGEVGSAPS